MDDSTLQDLQGISGVSSEKTEHNFTVYHSNRIERLAVLAAKLIKNGISSNPLDPVEFLIPNPGMEQWLNLKLAENLGISMRNVCSSPADFVMRLFAKIDASGDGSGNRILRKSSLVWIIYSELGRIASPGFSGSDALSENLRNAFKSVRDYVQVPDKPSVLKKIHLLSEEKNKNNDIPVGGFEWDCYAGSNDRVSEEENQADEKRADDSDVPESKEAKRTDETRLYQLSEALAGIFERYIVSRGDWLENASSSSASCAEKSPAAFYAENYHLYRQKCRKCRQDPESESESEHSREYEAGRKSGDVLDRMWQGISLEEFACLDAIQQKQVLGNMWQVILWERIAACSRLNSALSSKGQKRIPVCAAADVIIQKSEQQDPQLIKSLPENLFVFGFSTLEPLYLRLLKTLSRYTRIIFMYFNPSRFSGFEADSENVSSAVNRLRIAEKSFSDADSDILYETGSKESAYLDSGDYAGNGGPSSEGSMRQKHCFNRLLASWGKQGTDTVKRLADGISTAEYECFSDPLAGRKGVLQFLQSCILNSREEDPFRKSADSDNFQREQFKREPFIWEDLEHNLEIHSCYSKLREVEAVYDRILRLFEKDHEDRKAQKDPNGREVPKLSPNDIVVYAPDINAYAPYINGVFGREHAEYERCIPYRIADQKYGEISTFFASVIDLLSLPETPLTGSLVLKLLSVSAIRRRFGFTPEDVNKINDWIKKVCIRGDCCEDELLDSEFDRPEETIRVYSTWDRALRRMMAGSVMNDSDSCWLDDIRISDEMSENNMEVLASLRQMIVKLNDLRCTLREKDSLTPAEWKKLVNAQIIDEFYADDYENISEIYAVNNIIRDLAAGAEYADPGVSISREVFKECLEAGAGLDSGRKNLISGRICFCSFVPMRHIPYRHIFMIGMNSRDFPRREEIYDFDLVRRGGGDTSRAGDRNSRDDELFMFLQTLMSARDSIYISYIGRSIVTNAELNPSVVVTGLEHFLSENLVIKELYESFENSEKECCQSCSDQNGEKDRKLRKTAEDFARRNSEQLLKPGVSDTLVVTDAIHQWDPSNYDSTRGCLSYQSEWCPSDGAKNGHSFFRTYIAECLRQKNFKPSIFLSDSRSDNKNDKSDAEEKAERSRIKIIQHLLDMIKRSCFAVHSGDRKVGIQQLIDERSNNEEKNLLSYVTEELKRIFESGSCETGYWGRYKAVADNLPDIVLNYMLGKKVDGKNVDKISAEGYSIDSQMNTLVTDAGLFDCGDMSKDGNIQIDRRRLTLKISDLCRLADDPLDVLYSRRFNIGSDENEKYKKILEDTEPLDSPDDNDLDFSLREKIISYCRGIPDMLHFNDEEESRKFWCYNPVFIYAGLMKDHPEIMSGFSDDLKYSGLIPAGRDAVYKNPETGRKKEFEASEILGFDTRKYFMMGIRRLHYLYSKGYSLKPESVQVRCEFKLYGSELPEPYCSVFRDSNCAFTVAVEGTVDNIYTRTAEGKSNRKEYLHFRDIHKLQKQKFLFLLNSFLLNHQTAGQKVTVSRFIDLAESDEDANVMNLDDNLKKIGDEYLRQLVVCYLRGVTEPLFFVKAKQENNENKKPPFLPALQISSIENEESIKTSIMAAKVPLVPLCLISSEDRNYRILFNVDRSCDDLTVIAGKDREIYPDESHEEFQKTYLCKSVKNFNLNNSDTIKTYDYDYGTSLTVRQRMLFENTEKIPLRKTAATFFLLDAWPDGILKQLDMTKPKKEKPDSKENNSQTENKGDSKTAETSI